FPSSRTRHTSFSRDWSSDVCSSDLPRFHWTRARPKPRANSCTLMPTRRATRKWPSSWKNTMVPNTATKGTTHVISQSQSTSGVIRMLPSSQGRRGAEAPHGPPGPSVRRQDVVQVRGLRNVVRQHPFNHARDVGKPDAPRQKQLHGHLVG